MLVMKTSPWPFSEAKTSVGKPARIRKACISLDKEDFFVGQKKSNSMRFSLPKEVFRLISHTGPGKSPTLPTGVLASPKGWLASPNYFSCQEYTRMYDKIIIALIIIIIFLAAHNFVFERPDIFVATQNKALVTNCINIFGNPSHNFMGPEYSVLLWERRVLARRGFGFINYIKAWPFNARRAIKMGFDYRLHRGFYLAGRVLFKGLNYYKPGDQITTLKVHADNVPDCAIWVHSLLSLLLKPNFLFMSIDKAREAQSVYTYKLWEEIDDLMKKADPVKLWARYLKASAQARKIDRRLIDKSILGLLSNLMKN